MTYPQRRPEFDDDTPTPEDHRWAEIISGIVLLLGVALCGIVVGVFLQKMFGC